MKYLERKKERKQDEFFQYTIIQLFQYTIIQLFTDEVYSNCIK